MKIELLTHWHDEEFLAPFFLNHYKFVDRIHVFLDTATQARTLEIIGRYPNAVAHDWKEPNGIDDGARIRFVNSYYHSLDCDYVIRADADEFIFLPPGYLEASPAIVHFTRLWTVYRHKMESNLDPSRLVREQRRHGVKDFEGWDVYTKPNVVKAKRDHCWGVGFHDCWTHGRHVVWGDYNPDFVNPDPLTGAHWAMADPEFVIARRIKGRKERMSKANLERGFGRHQYDVTEESLRASFKKHENDPEVF